MGGAETADTVGWEAFLGLRWLCEDFGVKWEEAVVEGVVPEGGGNGWAEVKAGGRIGVEG